MQPYFNTPEKLASLTASASRWLGTPFRENSCVRGPRGGVSCHNLVAALYVETGALPPFTVPRGSARRLLHNPADTICAYIDTVLGAHFMPVGTLTPAPSPIGRGVAGGRGEGVSLAQPGDMLVLREGNVGKHVAIVIPGAEPHHTPRIVHVLLHGGVFFSELADATYASAILQIRRPITPATS